MSLIAKHLAWEEMVISSAHETLHVQVSFCSKLLNMNYYLMNELVE